MEYVPIFASGLVTGGIIAGAALWYYTKKKVAVYEEQIVMLSNTVLQLIMDRIGVDETPEHSENTEGQV